MPETDNPIEIDKKAVASRLAEIILKKVGVMDDYDRVMDVMGMGGDKPFDFARYFALVIARLDAIKTQLNNVEDAVRDVSRKQTAMQLSLTDAKLQQVLLQFEHEANVINQNYSTWHSATIGLKSQNADERQQGARLLFDLFSTQNMNFVEQSMLNVGSYLLGDNLFKGVLAYFPDVMYTAVINTTSDDSQRVCATVNGVPLLDSFKVLGQFYPQYYATIQNRILPEYNKILVVLHKGMTLLEMRYRKTIQENQLHQHYANVSAICSSMNSLWAQNTDPAALEPAMRRAFNDVGGKARVPNDLRNSPWASARYIHPDPWSDGGPGSYPFPPAFDQWITVKKKPEAMPRYWPAEWQTCVLLPPDFQFGTTVTTQSWIADGMPASRPWVAYWMAEQHPAHPSFYVPGLSETFGTAGAPPDLNQLGTDLTNKRLLQPPP